MKRIVHTMSLLGLFLTTSCASATVTPTSTSESILVTPVESAFAPNDPTAAPLEEIIESYTIIFDTPDGATIAGELYGSGDTAVIFSVMGNCDPGWREFAQLTAAQGISALTYQWRGCRESGSTNETELKLFVDDLRGAINFMREQGTKKIILAGASLGGCASAKLAVESGADGLIVIASPPEISQWGFEVVSADVDTNIPKLFVTAENDDTVSFDETRALFDLAAEPKEWQAYPGAAHGTELFETEHGEDVQNAILEFILKIADQ